MRAWGKRQGSDFGLRLSKALGSGSIQKVVFLAKVFGDPYCPVMFSCWLCSTGTWCTHWARTAVIATSNRCSEPTSLTRTDRGALSPLSRKPKHLLDFDCTSAATQPPNLGRVAAGGGNSHLLLTTLIKHPTWSWNSQAPNTHQDPAELWD